MSPKAKKDPKKSRLSGEALEKVAETFRALSDAGRLALLQELKDGEQMVGELVDSTGMGQASVSKHLKTMFDAGLLSRRKEGVKVFYAVKDELVFSLCRLVCGKLDEDQRGRAMVDFSI
ncbi:ArsR/SmtB family transcription factor [Haloferula chungangensis]|uniref:ArsR/SmtB family transcription factor n=1 Tax=Haloferula chungangensis TaxID=1048331 RepID=A0ABW2LD34_9BACT